MIKNIDNRIEIQNCSKNFRCGKIAIVGRPNVGKSTLMNAIIGQKISITSSKKQTTRYKILGIHTNNDTQYIFLDTPGLQTAHSGYLNKILSQTAYSALTEANLILFVTEASHFVESDLKILKLLAETALTTSIPILLILNKVDLILKSKYAAVILEHMKTASERYHFKEIIPTSAKAFLMQSKNMQSLLKTMRSYLPIAPAQYSHDQITDHSDSFRATEIIREKIFRSVGDEIPYSCIVAIDKLERRENLLRIFATIFVNRPSQKAILIGSCGAKLKQISIDARLDMEKKFKTKVYLELWVRTKNTNNNHIDDFTKK